ncbi:uncharacterized protein A1O9_03978 [Exophiala aquamarina CBS 119918]|uniref:Alcohol dehydrogenase n=1 Tax=Exophiala aquamarina CBS 119918 TaxID=1182545 RepID=A0A072PG64_9EURO|nr:uncharacterized protein A1O9_03978 [Exophiala aquamarina CBS 119918]KEF59134.1 hypothetical protein A1O9_03978 [Exophiala aquamarina CBS 119918]
MTTNPDFNKETTATAVAQAFSDEIRGKVIVVVGVSPQSIGESMALALAAHEPSLLVFASRTKWKMEKVSSKVKTVHSNAKIELVEVDLSSFASVREGTKAINQIVDRIDILINNAAVVLQEHKYTTDGLEMQFGTNHMGPFLLTNLLLPKLIKAAEESTSCKGSTRIINLTSAGHILSPIRFSDHVFHKRPEDIPLEERPMSRPGVSFDPPPGETYVPFVAYGQSKTANILFSVSLTQKLSSQGIRSIATHPGSIWTDLSRHLDEKNHELISKTAEFWKDLDQGAATTLVAALDPKLSSDLDVIYLSDCQVAQAADHARDQKAAERLWQLSEAIVGRQLKL